MGEVEQLRARVKVLEMDNAAQEDDIRRHMRTIHQRDESIKMQERLTAKAVAVAEAAEAEVTRLTEYCKAQAEMNQDFSAMIKFLKDKLQSSERLAQANYDSWQALLAPGGQNGG